MEEERRGGIGADGVDYSRNRVDWHDEGDLLGDAFPTDKPSVVYPATYAEPLNKRYPMDGISPQGVQDFEIRIADLVREGIEATEE
jgi:hypothetical protein